ncbi:uncharacterized protein LOC113280705 [Papaver somniferum]|uniref:uncharacterized protein LOC113280705 n=1 Tax=Papaver somniferum TaxID=3469 RepID=UPI000E70463D|nr:uncharacterized protein LOC113280705 [Papaver somniferum]
MALSVIYLISIFSLVFIVQLRDAESMITSTCKFTASVDLCTQILNADPSREETDTAVRIVTECSTLYVNAKVKLETSIRDMYSDDSLGNTQSEVNAAASCAESCERSFSTATPALAYPDELARRKNSFEDICGVTYDIVGMLLVDDLQSQGNSDLF